MYSSTHTYSYLLVDVAERIVINHLLWAIIICHACSNCRYTLTHVTNGARLIHSLIQSVMLMHCALYAKFVAKVANGLPYMITGDFNIKPDSSMYTMFTTGKSEIDLPEVPHSLITHSLTHSLRTHSLTHSLTNSVEYKHCNSQFMSQFDPLRSELCDHEVGVNRRPFERTNTLYQTLSCSCLA